ncbi:MAG: serine hydrolase [Armatimonadota bacterium]
MNHRIRNIYTASILITLIIILTGVASAATSAVSIPYIDKIIIDGQSSDWENNGYYVGMMSLRDNRAYSTDNLEPFMRLGWNDKGLVLYALMKDNRLIESDEISTLYLGDSIEVWVASKNPNENYQTAIAPVDGVVCKETRIFFWDWRTNKDKSKPLSVDAKTIRTSDGYAVEALFPWSNLNLAPAKNLEIGFQIMINDFDAPKQSYDDALHAFWTPEGKVSAFYTLKLSDRASNPVYAATRASFDGSNYVSFDIDTHRSLIGKKITVSNGKKRLASGMVEQGPRGWGYTKISIPIPEKNTDKEFNISCEGTLMDTAQLPGDPGLYRVREFNNCKLRFTPCVFSGTEFPQCSFEQSMLAENIIGPYTIKSTFYDANYNEVKTADNPGRYGAVVEVTPENGGKTIRRFFTLYRQPAPIEWWNKTVEASMKFPDELGIDPAVAEENSSAIADMLKWNFADSFFRDPNMAKVMAGLYESKPIGKPQTNFDPFIADRQWWVSLKRKFYGTDKIYPNPIVAPTLISGKPAPVLHEGSLQEAGMKPDTVEILDKLLEEWAANSDEGFATLIARHGVIVLHKAYGMRGGKPMTVDTKSWMASNTKTMSANLMWMLVDQGLVDLDDPVDKFLPAFKGINVKKPMTIRHLYTHTWGLDNGDHWGDDMNDLEEIIAGYYPHLKIAEAQVYNGVGYAVGGKIIETISGESIPAFYKKHLLDPLGCANTDVTDTCGGSSSVPMDMGKIAQLMLNKGTYGNLRFYSEDTFNKMLPDKLSKILQKPDGITMFADGMWGVGLMSYENEGLGKGTFGHGAASGATLRIDPVNDLVVVMTRDNVGKDSGVYSKYHDLFIKAVIAGIDNNR